MNNKEKEILDILDEGANNLDFPSFANENVHYCGAKMNIFSDSRNQWLIVIQWIGYMTQGGTINNIIIGFQNKPKPVIDKSIIVSDLLINRNLISENGKFIGNIFDFNVEINGKNKKVQLTEQDYYNAKILNLKVAPEALIGRYCVEKFPDEFYKTSEEILELTGNTGNLTPLLTLDDWEQPNLVKDQLPSQMESFQMIAKVIVNNDPSLFNPDDVFFNVKIFSFWDRRSR